ncbi:MAG TPA: hypothetical protein VH142_03145 [Polyangiaceae bacterium]|nr:hypothetical protein [Polyangiaceae bacterium]
MNEATANTGGFEWTTPPSDPASASPDVDASLDPVEPSSADPPVPPDAVAPPDAVVPPVADTPPEPVAPPLPGAPPVAVAPPFPVAPPLAIAPPVEDRAPPVAAVSPLAEAPPVFDAQPAFPPSQPVVSVVLLHPTIAGTPIHIGKSAPSITQCPSSERILLIDDISFRTFALRPSPTDGYHIGVRWIASR